MFRYFFLFLFIPTIGFCQISEDWVRSDLTAVPQWIGDVDCFSIDGVVNRLSLNAPAEASEVFLFTASEAVEDAVWQFDVSFDFNPSSSNYSVVYLCANQCIWSEDIEGYYVKIGGQSDEVSLWRRKGGVEIRIIDGRDKVLDLSACRVSIKVERDRLGNWILSTDVGAGGEYVEEGRVLDSEIVQSQYFGIYCKFTATRSTKFHFGPISVTGNAFRDVIPPEIVSHKLIQGSLLELGFTEELDVNSVSEAIIRVNGELLNITKTESSGEDILIVFGERVNDAGHGEINISGFKDLYGNTIRDTTIYYCYYKPERFDLLISEIMVDPTPSVGLPEYEYLELYNSTPHPIQLEGYQIIINDKSSILPSYNIQSSEHIVLADLESYEGMGEIPLLLVDGLGAMTNSSGEIVVVNDEGQVSDAIRYPLNTGDKDFKWDGGWSLEKKDYQNFDQSGNNWKYSMDLDGGTPGEINSVCGENNDGSQPKVNYISYLNDSVYQIRFSEAIDTMTLVGTLQVEGAEVCGIITDSVYLDNVTMTLASKLSKKEVKVLGLDGSIADIAGNAIVNDYQWLLGVPEQVDSFDVCINELVFNPESGGYDFIELFNRSDKIINLSDLYVASAQNGLLDKLNCLNDKNQLMFPGEYRVLCEDTSWLNDRYTDCCFQKSLECDLPSLNNEKGNVAITLGNGKIIDFLEYTEEMHFALLNSYDGVSLERLDVNRPTNDENNWHSASSVSGFATPSLQNSQKMVVQESKNDKRWIWLEEDVFSPNADGDNDYLVINYQLPEVGYTGTIKVFDRGGRPVATIVDNALLDAEGFVKWGGVLDSKMKAPMGIYLIYAEIFSLKGDVKKEKLVCVVNAGAKK